MKYQATFSQKMNQQLREHFQGKYVNGPGRARIFLLVDLPEFFSDLGSGGRKKINKKAPKMTS